MAQQRVVDGRIANETGARVLDRPVTLRLDGVSLKAAVQAVASSAGVGVQYKDSLLEAVKAPVSLRAERLPLGQALGQVLGGTNLTVVAIGDALVGITPTEPAAKRRDGIVVGTVVDAATGQPIAGATVTLDDGESTTTAADGSFRFANVSAGEHRVMVRRVGYARSVRVATIQDGETVTIALRLETRATALDQVVVTGTVVATAQKSVPNAITVITAKELEQRGITRIDQLFRGDVPGIFAANRGTVATTYGPNNQTTMYVRGAVALPFSQGYGPTALPIKTYVDGVELANPSYLAQIDPKSIERIEIIAGPQASTVYGSNALNGVMQIFTKRGASSTPRVTLNALSGVVENDFSSATAPQHDYSAQVDGTEGRISYSAGGSWVFLGRWTPSMHMTTTGGFAGIAMKYGTLSVDGAYRRDYTMNDGRGALDQTAATRQGVGIYIPDGNGGAGEDRSSSTNQTAGLNLDYAPFSWWGHHLTVGNDVLESEKRYMPSYVYLSDTAYGVRSQRLGKTSVSYNTTLRAPITSIANLTLTLGAEEWTSLYSTAEAFGLSSFSGPLATNNTQLSREPSHNTGAFLQGQMMVWEALTLTYGLRAEWNPNFGAEAQPNYAPRAGLAYAFERGALTGKVRASYGKSTRPPRTDQKDAQSARDVYGAYAGYYLERWGEFDVYLANPKLGPEYQRGGEGGIELYFGNRGSVTVTRYNQTVEDLITSAYGVDSVPSLVEDPYGLCSFYPEFCYAPFMQSRYLNIGTIRNQGWDVQATWNVGPLSAKGTYSWVKSRMIGLRPEYRTLFSPASYPQFQPGTSFIGFPARTWAVQVSYALGGTSVMLNVHGIGELYSTMDAFYAATFGTDYNNRVRVPNSQPRVAQIGSYVMRNGGYTEADVNASHRVSRNIEAIVQVLNLGNVYHNDDNVNPVIGRQSKIGLRIRL